MKTIKLVLDIQMMVLKYSDEVKLNKKIKELEFFVDKEEMYNLNLYSIKK